MENNQSPTALQVATYYDKDRMQQMLLMADKLVKARCFGADVQNAEQAFVKIQAGYEMGLPPVESLNSLYIVNGKITIYGNAMTKRLRLKGWRIAAEESEGSCKVTVSRGDESYSYTATIEELLKLRSKAANFASKDKLFWHAVSRIIRRYVPEVLEAGVGYLAEEAEFLVNEEKPSVAVVADDVYTTLLFDIQDAKTLEELEKVKSAIVAVGSTFTDIQQVSVKETLRAKIKSMQTPTVIKDVKLNEVSLMPNGSVEVGVDPAEPGKDEQETVVMGDEAIRKGVEDKEVIVEPSTPKADKPWKRSLAAYWTPTRIKNTVESLSRTDELHGLKDDLNRLLNEGEITDAVHKEGVALIQSKVNTLWGEKSKEQGSIL